MQPFISLELKPLYFLRHYLYFVKSIPKTISLINNIFFKAIKAKMLKIFSVSFEQNKKRLLLLIPENTGDRAFSVCKTRIPTEYREKGISRDFKN